MRARIVQVVAGAALMALGVPTAASAEKFIEAQTVWRFDASSYAMDQGEALTFRNRDAASPGPHNVVASDKGPDGQPLFASKSIRNGEDAPVERASAVPPGSYEFICTVHPFMQATLEVKAAGAPAPTPPAPEPPPPASTDTRPPSVIASLARTSLTRALRRGRFRGSVSADEPSELQLRLTGRIGRRVVDVGVGSARIASANARAPIVVRIRPSARRALRRARSARLTLAVEARDSAGNVGTTTARRTVRR